MASYPSQVELRYNAMTLLNTIRANNSASYQDRVPEATRDNIREVGAAINNYQATQNEFLNALVNRIALVLVTSKSYENPWKKFKKGILSYGEAVEEIFVQIAKAHNYDPETAEKELYKREIPDVLTAFHRVNSKLFYKTTVSNEQLRLAFLSENGLQDLIGRIVDSLYSGAETDEYLTMKQMVTKGIMDGDFYPVHIETPSASTIKGIVSQIKGMSNKLTFMGSKYNAVGVTTHTPKSDQVLLIDADFDAMVDVEVLAAAFNMSKAEFMGQRVIIDDFGEATGVYAAIVDKDYFNVWDSFIGFTENYNGQGLYWNYFYHVWKIYSTSPFANAIVFTTEAPAVTKVTVTPTTQAAKPNDKVQFTAVVTASGYAPKDVYWTTSDGKIDATGLLEVPGGFASGQTITVTATSVYDSSKSASATVTYKA